MKGHWLDVSGVGVVSSAGLGLAGFRETILSGAGTIGEIGDGPTVFRFTKGAPVRHFEPSRHLDARSIAGLDRFTQFAVVAAREAATQAALSPDALPSAERIGVIIGTANGGIDILDEGFRRIHREQRRPRPMTIPMTMASAPASRIAREIGARGPVFGISSACASAGHAILMGAMLIRSGLIDLAIVGGADACFSDGYLQAWDSLRVVSADTCRPFSIERRGLIIGEGAGVLVLERPGRALARGSNVIGRLAGGGMSSDAGDLVAPDQAGMRDAMAFAMADTGLGLGDVDYINAHGTGTVANDAAEAAAIKAMFGSHTDNISVSSTKSMIGHAMGASGALEAIASMLAIEAKIVPPTINYLGADPACAIDPTPNTPRPRSIRTALSNSFGFGGLNVSLAFVDPDY